MATPRMGRCRWGTVPLSIGRPDPTRRTFNEFLDEWDSERKIDFVFVEAASLQHLGVTIDSAEILMERVDGRWPSDHFAVTAGVTLGD